MNRIMTERQLLGHALAPAVECLSIEELGRLQDGLLPADTAAEAMAHLATCPSCQVERELLHEFQVGEVRADETDLVREGQARLRSHAEAIYGGPKRAQIAWRPHWKSAIFRSGLAAAAVLLLSIGSYMWRPGVSNLPVQPDGSDVTRSLSIAGLAPVGDVSEAPSQLEWNSVNGAVRYRVRLMEVDRHELWASDVATTRVALPDAVRAVAVPAKTLVWQVTALDAGGAALAESAAQRFRVTPSGSKR
jgi:anti-sigma factor RsiW